MYVCVYIMCVCLHVCVCVQLGIPAILCTYVCSTKICIYNLSIYVNILCRIQSTREYINTFQDIPIVKFYLSRSSAQGRGLDTLASSSIWQPQGQLATLATCLACCGCGATTLPARESTQLSKLPLRTKSQRNQNNNDR